MAFVILFIVLGTFGGLGFATWKILKKTDPKNVDTSLKSNIETAQDYLPFTDIKDSMIQLGDHKYRLVFECSSINFDLKTEAEQLFIESGFQRVLNSLTSPITIFISTREIDNSFYVENLKSDYEKTVSQYPELFEYCNQNYSDMKDLNDRLGVTRQKKKYIIVAYDEAGALTQSTDQEKYDTAMRELFNRFHAIQDGLQNIGIKSTILKTVDLIDLMVRTYNRKGQSIANEIFSQEYTNFIVDGNFDKFSEENTHQVYDEFLSQMEERLKYEFASNTSAPVELQKNADLLWKAIRDMRRQDDNSSAMSIDELVATDTDLFGTKLGNEQPEFDVDVPEEEEVIEESDTYVHEVTEEMSSQGRKIEEEEMKVNVQQKEKESTKQPISFNHFDDTEEEF